MSITGDLSDAKKKLRSRQARLPVEEKIRILVELQKITLTLHPARGPSDLRKVWQID